MDTATRTKFGSAKRASMNHYNFKWDLDCLKVLPITDEANPSVTSGPLTLFGSSWRFHLARSSTDFVVGDGIRKGYLNLKFKPDNTAEWGTKGLETSSFLHLHFEKRHKQWNNKSKFTGKVDENMGFKFFVSYTYGREMEDEEVIHVSWTISVKRKIPDFLDANNLDFMRDHMRGNLSSDMLDFYQGGPFKDLIVKCGYISFFVHKSILAAKSNVFLNMLQDHTIEANNGIINILTNKFGSSDTVSAEAVREMLKWVYTKMTPLADDEDWFDILALAHAYNLRDLEVVCVNSIAFGLCRENISKALTVANLIDSVILKESAYHFFLSNKDIKEDLINSGEYDKLDVSIQKDLMLRA